MPDRSALRVSESNSTAPKLSTDMTSRYADTDQEAPVAASNRAEMYGPA